MRLTLRTLLAYLDDILEPSQARELGEKIQESPLATSLVSKIQDVVRRRRIGAPEVSGPGSEPDPNTVAEYLDNTLPPEAISELERICLESEPHLAEVAACHQVLTLVLGKPVEVPHQLREQMYALGAVAPGEVGIVGNGLSRHVPRVVGVGTADVSRNVQPQSGEQDLLTLPSVPTRTGSGWKRALPYLVGVVIVAAWGYLIVTDYFPLSHEAVTQHAGDLPDIEAFRRDSSRGVPKGPITTIHSGTIEPEIGQPETLGAPSSEEPIDVEIEPEEIAQAASALASPGVPPSPAGKEPARDTEGQLATPVADGTPDSGVAAPDTTGASAPAADAIAAAGPGVIEPAPGQLPSPPPPAEPVAIPVLEALSVQYASTEGVLLYRETAAGQWAVTPRRALIFPEEEIASPDPFEASLVVSQEVGECEVVLRSGARIRSLAPTAETQLGWEIDRGRVLFSRRNVQPPDASLPMRLKIRDDEWLCQLTGPEVALAIEVIPVHPTGVGDMRGRAAYGGRLQLVSGAARLTNLSTHQIIELTTDQGFIPFSADSNAPVLEPEAASSVPDWMLVSTGPSSLARQIAVKFEREFLPEQPVAASIRPVVKDKQPRISELATRTLALTGSMPGLVDALSAPHLESRIAAIEGLRDWLPRDEQHGVQLDAELQNRYREGTAAALSRLLWGYSEQDARNADSSRELVDWLGDDEIAVRELAFYHVQRLTNRTYGYRTDRRADERDAALRHWRERLQKYGALVGE